MYRLFDIKIERSQGVRGCLWVQKVREPNLSSEILNLLSTYSNCDHMNVIDKHLELFGKKKLRLYHKLLPIITTL